MLLFSLHLRQKRMLIFRREGTIFFFMLVCLYWISKAVKQSTYYSEKLFPTIKEKIIITSLISLTMKEEHHAIPHT